MSSFSRSTTVHKLATVHRPPRRIIHVASIPKAGTYLFKEIVKSLGFFDRKIHLHHNSATRIDGDGYGDTFPNTYFGRSGRPIISKNTFEIDVSTFLSTLMPGDIFVSHLPPHTIPYEWHSAIQTIFCVRNPFDALERDYLYGRQIYNQHRDQLLNKGNWHLFDDAISVIERFSREEDVCRGFRIYLEQRSHEIVRLFGDLYYWTEYKNCILVRLEDARQKDSCYVLVAEIAKFLGIDISKEDAELVAHAALAQKTATKSPSGESKTSVWTDENLKIARSLGIPQLAEIFGYPSFLSYPSGETSTP